MQNFFNFTILDGTLNFMEIITNFYSLLDKANHLRGGVMGDLILIEKLIDGYIADHFCSSHLMAKEMHLLILGDNRMSFESKKQVFQQIVIKHDLHWSKSYHSYRNDDRKKGRVPLFGDLDYVITKRNILAHCWLDTSVINEPLKAEKLVFVRFKNDIEEFDFSEKMIEELNQILYTIADFIPTSKRFRKFRTASNKGSYH